MRCFSLLFAALVFFALADLAAAQVLWDQTQYGNPGLSFRSDSLGSGSVAVDDFGVGGPFLLAGVGVRGRFDSSFFGMATLDGFKVNFYTDNSGTPGNLAYSETSPDWTISGNLYQIPLTIHWMEAGTYWLGVQAQISDPLGLGEFRILQANDLGNGDPASPTPPATAYVPRGNAAQTLGGNSYGRLWSDQNDPGWFAWRVHPLQPGDQKVDLAFSVFMVTVPEPSSGVLLVAALLALAFFRIRRGRGWLGVGKGECMGRHQVLLALVVLLGICGMLQANVLMDQLGAASSQQAKSSDLLNGGNMLADDFTLLANCTISTVKFNGSWDSGPLGDCVLNGFKINFYHDNAGSAGSLLSTQTINGWSKSGNLYTVNLTTPQHLYSGKY